MSARVLGSVILVCVLALSSVARADESQTTVAPRVEGGYAFRRLFSLDFNGFDVAAGVQIEPKPALGVFARARYGYGRAHGGLTLDTLRLEGGVEARPTERFRIGGDIGLGYLWVPRATSGTLVKVGLGFGVLASFDVIHADDLSLFVGAHAGAELYPHFEKDWGIAGVLLSAGPIVGARF